jgi:hypothetical protein
MVRGGNRAAVPQLLRIGARSERSEASGDDDVVINQSILPEMLLHLSVDETGNFVLMEAKHFSGRLV